MGKRVLSSTNKLPPDLGGFPVAVPNKSLYFDPAGAIQLEDRIDSAAFTPIVTAATPGDLSVAYTIQTGIYDKKGKWVFIQSVLSFTPTYTTASGDLRIGGLPAVAANGAAFSTINIASLSAFVWPNASTQIFGSVVQNQNYMTISGLKSNATVGTLAVSAFPTGSTAILRISGMYKANS